jgi:multidrug resistance protein MdtO
MLAVSTTLPAFPPIWGFIFCTLIALWETHVPEDTAVKNSLWLLAATTLPVAVSIAIEYVFGVRHPVDELQAARCTRYLALEAMYRLYSQEADAAKLLEARLRVIRLAAAGQQEMQRLYNTIVDRDLDPGPLPVGARVRISMLAQLMDVSAAFATQHAEEQAPEKRQRCARIADVCRDFSDNFSPNEEGVLPIRAYESTILLDRVERILQDILAMPSQRGIPTDRRMIALPSKKVPYFIPGALTNKDNVAFALKLSLCATSCYILYFAVDWPGISTAVTTVFITGLSTTGAIKQKYIYRIMGAIIGGLILGLGATAFLFSYMDSITSLVILMGAVALLSAWMAGGRKFNYVGLQIAFSFYLVALEGFSAPTQLAPARDRLAGILLALIVMWFVFDRLWPVRTVTIMRRTLASVLQNDIGLLRLDHETIDHEERLRRADTLRDRIGKTVASLRTMNDEVGYELGVDRQRHIRTSEAIVKAGFTTVAIF